MSAAERPGPVIQRLDPPGLAAPTGYSHVVSVTGGRTVYVSGQVALDADGRLVGLDDFAAQTVQVFENLFTALRAAGAGFDDVVKATYYVRDASRVALVRELRRRYFTGPLPASTLVEVPQLAHPDFLIEVEVIAVVP